jgi:hypothetical protein
MMSDIQIAHFRNRPLFDMQNFSELHDKLYDVETILCSPKGVERVKEIMEIIYKFESNLGTSADFIFVSLEDYRMIISGINYNIRQRMPHAGVVLPKDIIGVKIVVVPTLDNPQCGIDDPQVMLGIDYYEKG